MRWRHRPKGRGPAEGSPSSGLDRKPAACIVKVDPQPWGLLITVTLNRDLVGLQAGRVHHFTECADAVAVVKRFLESQAQR